MAVWGRSASLGWTLPLFEPLVTAVELAFGIYEYLDLHHAASKDSTLLVDSECRETPAEVLGCHVVRTDALRMESSDARLGSQSLALHSIVIGAGRRGVDADCEQQAHDKRDQPTEWKFEVVVFVGLKETVQKIRFPPLETELFPGPVENCETDPPVDRKEAHEHEHQPLLAGPQVWVPDHFSPQAHTREFLA